MRKTGGGIHKLVSSQKSKIMSPCSYVSGSLLFILLNFKTVFIAKINMVNSYNGLALGKEPTTRTYYVPSFWLDLANVFLLEFEIIWVESDYFYGRANGALLKFVLLMNKIAGELRAAGQSHPDRLSVVHDFLPPSVR